MLIALDNGGLGWDAPKEDFNLADALRHRFGLAVKVVVERRRPEDRALPEGVISLDEVEAFCASLGVPVTASIVPGGPLTVRRK